MLGAAPTPGHPVATLEHRFWGSQSMVNIYLHEVEGKLERVVPGPDIRAILLPVLHVRNKNCSGNASCLTSFTNTLM